MSQLARCLSEATNSSNDNSFTLQAIRNVSIRPNGNALAWSYVKSNWDSLYEKYYSCLSLWINFKILKFIIRSSVTGLTSLITDITNKFNNQDQYDDVIFNLISF